MDYYGDDLDYIHLKFGDMRKQFNFTEKFENEHPNFVKEFYRYWDGKSTLFTNPLQIINYVDMYGLKIHFYFNMTDTPAKDYDDVRAYLNREHIADVYGWKKKHNPSDFTFNGVDGEERATK